MKFNGAMLRGLLVGSLALVMAGGVCVPGLAQSKSVAGLSSLPANAQAPVSAALGKDDSSYWARPSAEGFRAENARQALAADFTKQGTEVRSHNQRWVLETQAYGYGNVLHPLKAVAPQANANRVEYRRDGVTEWYANGPLGLEQGFTLTHRPGTANGQPLTLELGLSGDLVAALESAGSDKKSNALELRGKDGKAALHYTGLQARDASGRELRSWLELSGERLLVRVDDRAARYPVVIDPWVQLAELTASDGAAHVSFGYSIAVSGSTVVVGSPFSYGEYNPGQGAAYVFGPSGTGWTQQAELTPAGGGECFGTSVAVSGGTAVVGDSCSLAAYVFVQSGTDWSQTAELTSSDGSAGDNFGASVAVSGNTAVVGAIYHTVGSNGDQGAAYVFVQSGTDWSQTAELTSSDGAAGDNFGTSVAVSGSTAVVGALNHTVGSNAQQGAGYVFVGRGGTWSQQAELTASDGAAGDNFGNSVAVSGSTAVVGAPDHTVGSNSYQGAAYIFVQSGTDWSQQAELTSSDGAAGDFFGTSVAVSGSTAVVGAIYHTVGSNGDQGAGYVFVQSGTDWSQTAELTSSDGAAGDNFGASVAVSGSTAVVGAPYHTVGSNAQQGAAYVFGLSPFTFSPTSLSFGNQTINTTSAPQTVTITNSGTSTVNISSISATEYFEVTATTCGSTLDVGASCTATVTFTPTLGGAITGTLVVNDNATGDPQAVGLSGTGVIVYAQVTITPSSLNFGNQAWGTISNPKSVTIKNVSTNNAVLYFSGFSLTGSGDFGISANTCGASLAVNKTCKVSLIYFPGLYGAELATLSIAGTVSGSPLTVAVSGTGVEDATLTPASHTFPRTKVGNTSTAHTFTLKNNLSTTLTGISYSTAAPFAVSASTCGTTLNSKTSCTISVTFSPTATGTTTGTLIVEDNSNSSTLIANLTGTGD